MAEGRAGTASPRILVGVVAGPHGVRGLVKVRSYTAAPADIAAYGPLTDADGRRRLILQVLNAAPGGAGSLICRIEGVEDRNAAEALKGLRLYIQRDALPAPEPDEFYHADLVGMVAELPDGTPFGRVTAVQNYGAGDFLEIERPEGHPRVVDLPFTRAAVPVVDIAGGRIVIDPPAGLLEPPQEERRPRRRGARGGFRRGRKSRPRPERGT